MWSSKNISSISSSHSRNGNCSVLEKCSGLFISICRIQRRFSVHHELHGYLKKSVKAKSWNIFKLFYNSNKAQCSWDSDKWASHEMKSHDLSDVKHTAGCYGNNQSFVNICDLKWSRRSNIQCLKHLCNIVYYISYVTFECMFSKQTVSINQCNSAPTQFKPGFGETSTVQCFILASLVFY